MAYLMAFSTWFQVTERDPTLSLSVVVPLALPDFGPVKAFCSLIREPLWAADRKLSIAIEKSSLLYRLLYLGEPLRTQKCPVHLGVWHGIQPVPCPHGCGLTGWLPKILDPPQKEIP